MSAEFQNKLDRFMARFPDGGMPIDSRHMFELFTDLHDIVSVLTGRVANLEEQVTNLNTKMG